MSSLTLRVLAPFGLGRSAALRVVGPFARPLLRGRALRVRVHGAVSVDVALGFATVAPLARAA